MDSYVLGLQDVDRSQIAVAGGKGANLGELSRIEGIRVPAGFCLTTDAFRRTMTQARAIDDQLDALSRLGPDDREAIRALSANIRETIEATAIPSDTRRRSQAHSPDSGTKALTPSDRAQRQKTYRLPPSRAKRTRT